MPSHYITDYSKGFFYKTKVNCQIQEDNETMNSLK